MKFKKILSLLTAAAMTLSLGITSVSADTTDTTTVASVKIDKIKTKYTTLKEAIAAANEASSTATVTLTSNASIDKTLVLTKEVTLDLGAYTITNNSQGEAICVAFGKGNVLVKATSGGITSIGKPCFVIKGDSEAYKEIKAATKEGSLPAVAQLKVTGGTYDSGKDNVAIAFATDAPENCQLLINNTTSSGAHYTTITGGINLDSGKEHRITKIQGKTTVTSSCEYAINAGKSSKLEISTKSTINSYGTYAIYAPQGSAVTVNQAYLHIHGNRGLYADGGAITFAASNGGLYAEGTNTQYIFDAANRGSVTVTGGGEYYMKNASNVFGNGVTIKRGTYYLENASNVFADNEVRTTISGGKFHGTPKTIDAVKERIAAGSENAVNTFPVVAKISDTKTYTTLAEAFAAAANGDTITLVDDADITAGNITVDGIGVTLNLNGHGVSAANTEAGNIDVTNGGKLTLTGNGTIRSTNKGTHKCLIDVTKGSKFVMESGSIKDSFEDPLNNGSFAVGVWDGSTFTMNGGEIEAGWYCAATNGTTDGANAVLNINNGKLVSTMDYAIYAPAINGVVNVTGGTIEGAAGAIALNRGTLNVTGGTLISTNTGDTGSKYNDGTCNMHNSVIDFGSKYEGGITATISAGELAASNGAYLFRFADYDVKSSDAKYYGVDLKITDGTFTADDNKLFKCGDKYDAAKSDIAISGGTFSSNIADEHNEFVADRYVCAKNTNGTYTVKERTEFGNVAVMTHSNGKLTLLSGINFLDYRNAGFIVDFGDSKATVDTTVVYENVNADGDTKAASDFGTNYIFGAEITLPDTFKTGAHTLTITPFANVLNKSEQIKAAAATKVNISNTDATVSE